MFRNEECLAQEFLDLTSTGNSNFVVLAQFFHTKDSDDVLKFLVALQNCLYATSNSIMFLTNYQWIKDTAGRIERINRWINT